MRVLVSALVLALHLEQLLAIESPIIGIMALPCSSSPKNCHYKTTGSFLPASYVKWIEGGGGRVVPIVMGTPKREVQSLIDNLNGVLLTGGSIDFEEGTQYWDTLNWILAYLRQTAHQSKFKKAVPLWATCLGFESLICATSTKGPKCYDTGFTAEDYPTYIDFEPEALTSSIVFGKGTTMDRSYATDAMDTFATQNVSHNSHHWGFYPKTLATDPYLTGNFTLLGTSLDQVGSRFVTFIQSKLEHSLFWYATQFHPEKTQYIYDPTAAEFLKHSQAAVFANQYLAEFFVNECRLRNDHVMDADMYWDKVIYNYNPWFSAKDMTIAFEQMYIFD